MRFPTHPSLTSLLALTFLASCGGADGASNDLTADTIDMMDDEALGGAMDDEVTAGSDGVGGAGTGVGSEPVPVDPDPSVPGAPTATVPNVPVAPALPDPEPNAGMAGAGSTPVDASPGPGSAGAPNTPTMDPVGNACGSSGECGPDLPYCNDAGTCVECLGSANCDGGRNSVCDVASNTCVQCVANTDCTGDFAPACDPATHECVQCMMDSDCPDDGQACDPTTRQCVLACESDAVCGGDTPFCNVEAGVCAECIADSQCGGDRPACVDGTCTCGGGSMLCGNACNDVQFDPNNCGACDQRCSDDEMCLEGACNCRIGLDRCGDNCRDLASDPANCGRCDNTCAQGEKCENGTCSALTDGCGPGLDECDGRNDTIACVDTDTDSANCGDCGETCDREELCVDGNCVEYARALECNQCPCDVCDQRLDNGVCCDVLGVPMCVEDGACPMLP